MTIDQQPSEADLRARAVASLQKKREFWSHLLAYVLVNGLLVAIWASTGAGFFWPIFPLLGWGIGIVFHALDVFAPTPSERRVRAEMDRLR
jgi:hypothetical protein